MNKSFIVLFSASLLLSASYAQGMWQRGAKIVLGAGAASTIGTLGKKYIYDPLSLAKKNRPYLAAEPVQQLSDQLLDAMTDHSSVRDRVHTWYLKKLHYNSVYTNDSLSNFHAFSRVHAYTPKQGGGIHVYSPIINRALDSDADWFFLEGKIAHENGHLHNRDITKISNKFPRITQLVEKLIKKRITQSFVNIEVAAEQKKVRSLYATGKYKALFLCFQEAKALEAQLPNDPTLTPYVFGTLIAIYKLIKEHPEDRKLVVIPQVYNGLTTTDKVRPRSSDSDDKEEQL